MQLYSLYTLCKTMLCFALSTLPFLLCDTTSKKKNPKSSNSVDFKGNGHSFEIYHLFLILLYDKPNTSFWNTDGYFLEVAKNALILARNSCFSAVPFNLPGL